MANFSGMQIFSKAAQLFGPYFMFGRHDLNVENEMTQKRQRKAAPMGTRLLCRKQSSELSV